MKCHRTIHPRVRERYRRTRKPEHPRHYDGELGLQLWPATARRPVSSVQLGFVVEDISATMRRLDAVGASWTCDLPNFVRTSDPEGNKITLTQRR